MRVRLSRTAAVVGVIAAALTCTGDFWIDTAFGGTLGDVVFGWSLIVASIPFGGLHNDPPVFLVFALCALINPLVWGGMATLVIAAIRHFARLRTHTL